MTASVYSWLTAQGLWPSSLAALVYWLIPLALGTFSVRVLKRVYVRLTGLWERHVRAQEDQARHLARVACQLEQPNKETP